MRGTLLSLILLPIFVFSAQKTQVHHTGADVPFEPWLTGPLLAATAINLEVGHPAILVSFTFLNTYGDYDSSWKFKNEDDIWSISLLLDFEFAITERIGMEVFGTGTMRFEDGDSVAEFDDTFLLLAYQISNDIKDSWVPDCRFYIQAIFPLAFMTGLVLDADVLLPFQLKELTSSDQEYPARNLSISHIIFSCFTGVLDAASLQGQK